MKTRKIISILLAAVMITSIAAGCKGRNEEKEIPVASEATTSTSSETHGMVEPEELKGETIGEATPDNVKTVAEKNAINPDAVGWFQSPTIGISDVVVQNAESNQFYVRRDFNKNDAFNGVLFADRRCTFGDGSVEQLGANTVIYGHAMADEQTHKNYKIFFGPLHDFRKPEVAKVNPYIFFSTEKENLAFEVFAVFVANTDNPDLPYNNGGLTGAQMKELVESQIIPRSIYNYEGVTFSETDKFLTLSTCIYTLPNGNPTHYPNTYMRYAIMGKLVDKDAPLKKEATFTVVENPLIDKDGAIVSKK